jgi:probable F420-dependent oxidoreductase
MKFWQSISWAEAEQLPDIARVAEEVGFHGVINSEHLFLVDEYDSVNFDNEDGKLQHGADFDYPDVWSSFGAMASVTTTLRFTSSIYLLPLRHPIDVAKMAATCARISNNRVSVGFGVGWLKDEFDALGVDFHTRGKRTDEMIEVMRKLWQGGTVSHHGRFFNFDNIVMRPCPTETIPFYCGGQSPAALRRAATLCDGYIGPGHKLEEAATIVAELDRLRAEAGRDHLPFETIIPLQPVDLSRGPDDYRRLEDLGVTATFLPPFDAASADHSRAQGLGPRSSIDAKRRMMEQAAENIIRKMSMN